MDKDQVFLNYILMATTLNIDVNLKHFYYIHLMISDAKNSYAGWRIYTDRRLEKCESSDSYTKHISFS